jgi:rhodanese-related sulfurtransferase
MRQVTAVVRDALVAVAACSAIGLAVNALRANGIPLVQKEPYPILVPCPEAGGHADAIQPGDPVLREAGSLLVDARAETDFAAWHPTGAIHVPYDYLEPTSSATLNRITASRAKRVIVYGDGGDPDSGEQLAREIAGKGIRNVGFLVGGAGALRSAPAEARAP